MEEAIQPINITKNAAKNVTHAISILDYYSQAEIDALRATTILLSITGFLGNLLVILVIVSRRRWRYPNSLFVLNIAIANIFICAYTLPLITRALFADFNWRPAQQFCQLSGFLDNTAFACSAWSLALGSVERFLLVVFPLKHSRWMTYKGAALLSGLIWALGAFLGILPIFGWNDYIYSPVTFSCGINSQLGGSIHHYYFIFYLLAVIPGPLLISSLAYAYILVYLRIHYAVLFCSCSEGEVSTPTTVAPPLVPPPPPAAEGEPADPLQPGQLEQQQQQDQAPAGVDIFGANTSELCSSAKRSRSKNLKVVLPMILITVTFIICFLPTVIIGFELTFWPDRGPERPMMEYVVIHLLLLANSAMSPIIFTMCSSKFRSSAQIICEILLERFLLVLLYIVYVIYYSAVAVVQCIGDFLTSLCTGRGGCLRKYDSLEDVVIKITLTNSDDVRKEGEEGSGGVKKSPKSNKTSETVL